MRFAHFLTSLLAASPALARRSLQHVGKGHKDVAYGRKLDARQAAPQSHDKRESNGTFQYLTSKTEKFAVNGTGIPDVDFDVGESYSGNLPISDDPNEDSSLFFWFFPSTNEQADKEILIWLNGGPGCSSLEGLSQENGPFLWQLGTFKPILNPWSWHHLTNVIWIEQPVGTGFSTGTVTATSEEDVAKQFMGFWKNFIDTFDMHGYKIYIAGESYAGLYCPYIASGMVDAKDTTYFDMSGMLIYDPVINNDVMLEVVPTVAFTDYWAGLFPFNDTFKEYIHKQNEKCGFAQFLDKYLVYPPAGPMPVKLPSQVGEWNSAWVTDECDLFDQVINATLLLNPCWDIYQVATTCPMLWDILGFPGTFDYIPVGADIYFNRTDVKKAIHAPLDVNWAECAVENVFVNGTDTSAPSSFHAIPNVIQHTNNVIIGHGALDMVLIANGTLLAIQNMTWNGKMGFQKKPDEPFFVPYHRYTPYDTVGLANMGALAAAGVFGTTHTERGLTYVGVDIAGHMSPGYAPSAAYRVVEFLLGRVKSVSGNEPFTFAPDIPQPPVSEFGKGTAPQGWSDAKSGGYQTPHQIRGFGKGRFGDSMKRKLKAM